MYRQCEFWNEMTTKCELQKSLDAHGIELTVPVERPPQLHIDNYCKTKQSEDCWRILAVKQMMDDAIFDEDFVPYVSVKQILWKWLKWAAKISIVSIIIFIMVILTIYFVASGGLYFLPMNENG